MAIVYLSGPMSGIADRNYSAFMKAANELRALGHKVINPAELFDVSLRYSRSIYMRYAIQNILEAEVVATLSGWEESRGAKLEVEVARECGVLVIPYEQLLHPVPKTVENPTLWD